MDGIIFLLVIVLIALIVIPIVVLIKVNRLSGEIAYMRELVQQLFAQKDSQELSKSIQKLTDKVDSLGYAPIELLMQPSVEPTGKPTEISVQEVTPTIEPPLVVEMVSNVEVSESVIEKPKPEEKPLEVTEESSVEETPAYAAFSKPQNLFSELLQESSSSPTQSETRNTEEIEEPEKSFIERILGENLLAKIGIVTLVLGIAFFVKYAIDQEWINEIGRVAIGLLTGGIIIAIAHKLKEKYHLFSSILVGGGISVFYITVTLAFREYQLFSQPVAFVLLIVITLFSVILSLFYDRKELAIFSLLGGFASPLMISTGTGNYIVLFSYILILNSGMLMVAFRRKWHIIGILSYVLTLLFFWTWLIASFEQQHKGATLFAGLFFAQFYILALIDHFKGSRQITLYQSALILTNNLSFFLACITIFESYSYDVKGLITIVVAVINAVIMVGLFRNSKVDRNLIYLLIGVVMTFVNLAIPIQLNGYVITLFWAAEMSVLLWLWQKSQIQLFGTAFLILSVLVIISYLMDVAPAYGEYSKITRPIALNSIFVTGFFVIVGFAAVRWLLGKQDDDTQFAIGKTGMFTIGNCKQIINFLLIVFTYSVPFLELNYQIERHLEVYFSNSLRFMAMAAYTSVYVSILVFVYRRELAHNQVVFGLLSAFVIAYSLFYWYFVGDLRADTYLRMTYPEKYFLLHFIAILPLTLVINTLVRNVRSAAPESLRFFYWGLTIVSTLLLSIESENISTMLFANQDNYFGILYDVRTFVFPVLWGIIALAIMIWGLTSKEVILRRISLVFFGLIIVKFYAFDVWSMSQAGRIVSFIMLGIIILSVSFLQQKIKTWVKSDSSDNNPSANIE